MNHWHAGPASRRPIGCSAVGSLRKQPGSTCLRQQPPPSSTSRPEFCICPSVVDFHRSFILPLVFPCLRLVAVTPTDLLQIPLSASQSRPTSKARSTRLRFLRISDNGNRGALAAFPFYSLSPIKGRLLEPGDIDVELV